MKTVYVLGEAMLELAPTDAETYRLGVAGDTFNTAVGLAQLGCPVEFIAGIGTDPGSERIREACARWGVGTSLIATLPDGKPGLYMIHTDAAGERSFSYWRGESAARELFSRPAELESLLSHIDRGQYIYLSGITLAIAAVDCRTVLSEFLAGYRRDGGRIAFDCNHRPPLWQSAGEAAASYENILQACDLFFAGADDLTSAWGLDEDALLPFLANLDCETILLKRGADNLLLIEGGEVREVETEPVAAIVDTTGAGDAFNAGYLAALLRQHNTNSAARFANILGAACLAHAGALLPEDTWHSLREALIED